MGSRRENVFHFMLIKHLKDYCLACYLETSHLYVEISSQKSAETLVMVLGNSKSCTFGLLENICLPDFYVEFSKLNLRFQKVTSKRIIEFPFHLQHVTIISSTATVSSHLIDYLLFLQLELIHVHRGYYGAPPPQGQYGQYPPTQQQVHASSISCA